MELGLKYLQDTDFSKTENGKYEILEDKVFAIVQEYTSKPITECKFEAHKKYIDIQYIVKGEEKIGVSDLSDFKELTPYNEEKDIIFLSSDKKAEFIKLQEKEFMILTPEDAHMPSIAEGKPNYVKKVVVKVHI